MPDRRLEHAVRTVNTVSLPMVTHNAPLCALCLALALCSSSCWFRKPTRPVFTPPPAQPQATAPAAEPPTLPAPPKVEGNPGVPPSTPDTIPLAPEPPKPTPRRGTAAAPPKPTTTPPPTTEPPALPKLGQIFTDDERRELNRRLDESLDRIKRALAVVERKPLNAEQSETADRIRTFQKQAEQAREQDLVTAVTLARRADLLAKDLLERLP